MPTQFFCYVYGELERTPLMLALDAESLPEAVDETRRMMAEEDADGAFAEIWDSSRDGALTRVEAPPGRGLIRRLRRDRPSSGSSKP